MPLRSPEHFANCLEHHFAAESSLGGLAEQSSVRGEAAVIAQHAGREVQRGVGARHQGRSLPRSSPPGGQATAANEDAANEDAGRGGLWPGRRTAAPFKGQGRPAGLEGGVSQWTFQSSALQAVLYAEGRAPGKDPSARLGGTLRPGLTQLAEPL